MNIKKILKFYLILTLTVTGLSLLSYSDIIKGYAAHYYASTLKVMEGIFDNSNYKYSEEKQYNTVQVNGVAVTKTRQNFKNKNTNYNFNISNDPGKAYALPGAKMVEIMQLSFKTGNQSLKLNSLKLKIEGVVSEAIEAAYLIVNDNIIETVRPVNGYLNFEDVDNEIDVNSAANIIIKLDLALNLKPGNRIRLDIENEEDLNLKMGNKKSVLTEVFPIKGKYLTIAVPRYMEQ